MMVEGTGAKTHHVSMMVNISTPILQSTLSVAPLPLESCRGRGPPLERATPFCLSDSYPSQMQDSGL